MAKKERRAEFVRWMGPLLDALRPIGGKASPHECSDWIAEKFKLPPEVTEAKMKSGNTRFHNQVQWARQYLIWEGLLDSTQRGVWSLSAKGAKTHLNEEASRAIFLKWVSIFAEARQKSAAVVSPKNTEPADEAEAPEEIEEQALIDVLLSIPPDGFE